MNDTVDGKTVLLVFVCIAAFLWWKMETWEIEKTPAPLAASHSLYSRADLPTHDELKQYITALVPAINRVAQEDWTCKENIDPKTVRINPQRTQHYREIVFQVHCWKDDERHSIIYFDIKGETIAPYMTDPFK